MVEQYSPSCAGLGLWVKQALSRSTGKDLLNLPDGSGQVDLIDICLEVVGCKGGG